MGQEERGAAGKATAEVRKVIRDGCVAVLVSPGYGAGWSTWTSVGGDVALHSPELVEAVEAGATADELKALVARLFPNAYKGGVAQLRVEWVKLGQRFRIVEYDGNESLERCEEVDWRIA